MTYTRNAVYDSVKKSITVAFPTAFCTSRYVPKPVQFPSCYIHEIDANRPLRGTQLDFQDVQWESVFEIQVVSARHGTAAKEAYAIMEVAKSAMSDLYYRQTSETNIDTADTFTIVSRFRRVIGGGDVLQQ